MAVNTVTVGMRVNYGGKDGEVKRIKVLGVEGTEVLYDDGTRSCYVGNDNTLFKQNANSI